MKLCVAIILGCLIAPSCKSAESSEGISASQPTADAQEKTEEPRLPSPEVANTDAFDRGMRPVLDSYLTIQEALAADTLQGVAEAAGAIATAAEKVKTTGITGKHAAIYKDMPKNIGIHAANIAGSGDLTTARGHFNGLSKAMSAWTAGARPPGIDMVFCSMAPGGWFQRKGALRNPYYGAKMLECGDIVSAGPAMSEASPSPKGN